MAKSKETFNKKEKEKKRLKHKQDKKQKMEERKANKKDGSSLEGMMAYLDENGNLTDTRPDPAKKRVFTAQSIQIGVPKQRVMTEEEEHRTGIVSFFNKPKGFGFINDSSNNERIFFHVNNILEPLEESDKVKFSVEHGPRGLHAVQVTKMV
jgi:cold shock CspA family protein